MAWCRLVYFDFYDFPRLFLTEWNGVSFAFDCSFDGAADEYSSMFRVSVGRQDKLPRTADEKMRALQAEPTRRLLVPVDSVIFDSTRRQYVDDRILVFICDRLDGRT